MKPFCVSILRYSNRVRKMNDLEKSLPIPSLKGESYEAANWKVCNQEFTVSEISVAIKDGLSTSMQDELYEHQEEYHSLAHE